MAASCIKMHVLQQVQSNHKLLKVIESYVTNKCMYHIYISFDAYLYKNILKFNTSITKQSQLNAIVTITEISSMYCDIRQHLSKCTSGLTTNG